MEVDDLKKVLSILLCLIFTMSLVCSADVGGISYTDDLNVTLSADEEAALETIIKSKFSGKTTVNLVFIGGSITFGAGVNTVNQNNSWVSLVGRKIQDVLGSGVKVNIYNRGISGTGSQLGAFRFAKQVLAYDPDMVFIEYAVNDAGKSMDYTQRYMETMTRELYENNPDAYLMYVYSYAAKNGETKPDWQKPVADYYKIADVDINDYIKNTYLPDKIATYKTLSGDTSETSYEVSARYWWTNPQTEEDKAAVDFYMNKKGYADFDAFVEGENITLDIDAVTNTKASSWNFWEKTIMNDALHPINSGYYIYAKNIMSKLAANGGANFTKVTWNSTPMTDVLKNPDMYPVATHSHKTGTWSTEANSKILSGVDTVIYSTADTNATMTYWFYGPYIGMFATTSTAAGNFDYIIDDTITGTVTLRKESADNESTTYTDGSSNNISIAENLSDGWHKIVLTKPSIKNSDGSEAVANISYFTTTADKVAPKAKTVIVNNRNLGLSDGTIKLDEGTKKLSVRLNGSPDYNVSPDLTVTMNGSEIIATGALNYVNASYDIELPVEAEVENEFEVTISNISYNGTTNSISFKADVQSAFRVTDFKLTDVNGEEINKNSDISKGIKASITISNPLEASQKVLFVAATKDSKGKLAAPIAFDSDEVSATSGEVELNVDVSLDGIADAKYIDLFLLDSFDSMKPLIAKVRFSVEDKAVIEGNLEFGEFVLDTSSVSNAITELDTEYDMLNKIVRVSGIAAGCDTVFVKIATEDGEVAYVNQISCEDDGTFSFGCKSKLLKATTYSLYVQPVKLKPETIKLMNGDKVSDDITLTLTGDVASHKINVYGTCADTANGVFIKITNSAGDVIYVNQVTASNGAFEYDCYDADIVSDTYYVNAVSY